MADALKISIRPFPASDAAGLVERLRTDHSGDVILVVGHSNTLPDLLKRLGHPAEETIADDDYGSLFVLFPREGQPPVVVRLRY
ncbi:MAG: uroporphyrinogen-III synthase [Desulfobacterales bacterium]|nr:uroporphyrinogen-III synthase [Desulfobacterales bacterium]